MPEHWADVNVAVHSGNEQQKAFWCPRPARSLLLSARARPGSGVILESVQPLQQHLVLFALVDPSETRSFPRAFTLTNALYDHKML